MTRRKSFELALILVLSISTVVLTGDIYGAAVAVGALAICAIIFIIAWNAP